MSRLFTFMSASLAGIAPSAGALCSAGDDDNLLAALGGWGSADSMGGGWSEADGLGDLSGLEGDDEEIGRRVRRAANRAGLNPAAMMQALARQLRGGGGGGGATFPAALPPMAQGAVMSSIAPGTPARGERYSWIPFPASAFTSVSGTTIVLRTTSQRPLRTTRMVGVERRTNGAGPPATSSILLTINEVKIGQEVQPAATGNAPFDAFAPGAFGLPVYFDPIDVNVPIEVTVGASAAPAAGERIDFAVAFFGYSIK